MSKCKLWSPLKIPSSIKILQGCTLVTYGLHIFFVLMGFQNFVTHFLDEALFQDMPHINNLLFLGDTQVTLGILSSCVNHQPSNLIQTIPPSSFMSFLVSFDMRVMQICGDIMGLRSWESI
jgi:hypothetical protein